MVAIVTTLATWGPAHADGTIALFLSDSGPGLPANMTLRYVPEAPILSRDTLALAFDPSFGIPAAFGVGDVDLLVDGAQLPLSEYVGEVASRVVVRPPEITVALGRTIIIPRGAVVELRLGTHAEAGGSGQYAVRTPFVSGTASVSFAHRNLDGRVVRARAVQVAILPHVALSAFVPRSLKNTRNAVISPTGVVLKPIGARDVVSLAFSGDTSLAFSGDTGDVRVGIAANAGIAGGVDGDLLVRKYAVSEVVATGVAPLPVITQVVGASVYDVTIVAQAQEFSALTTPLTLTFSYEPEHIVGLREETLHARSFDPAANAWVPLAASAVDRVARTVTATVDHLTLFGLFGSTVVQPYGVTTGSPSASPEEVWVFGCVLADITCDGVVDLRDLLIARERWRARAYDERADFNRDGRVDLRDLSVLLARWSRQ